jgi:hypothetical protein
MEDRLMIGHSVTAAAVRWPSGQPTDFGSASSVGFASPGYRAAVGARLTFAPVANEIDKYFHQSCQSLIHWRRQRE